MERVLITGAAGFLGSHLCDRFIAEGFKVEAMDNLITGDLKNIAHLQTTPISPSTSTTSRSTSILRAIWTTSCTLPHRHRLLTT